MSTLTFAPQSFAKVANICGRTRSLLHTTSAAIVMMIAATALAFAAQSSRAADPAPLTPAKVVKHKPADAVDAYWTPDGQRVNEVASWDPDTSWNKTYPIHLEPRLIAGAPITNDIMKCALKPVNVADYSVNFSKSQQARLKKIFPDGVCDWSKPGVGYSTIKATYQRY